MKSNFAAITLCVGLVFLSGCPSWESRVAAPKMDPETMTQQCMELVDEDGDGFLTETELAVTPGLLAALVNLDEDKDEKLSRSEIFNRFQLYVESRVGLQSFNCTVTYNNRPLKDGQVRLIPEPFMADYIEPAAGEVINAGTGFAEVSTDPELPGVRPGIYRVEITSPTVNVAPRYNEQTVIGIEVAPIQQENDNYHFNVKGR